MEWVTRIKIEDIKNYMVIIIIGILILGYLSYSIYDQYTEVCEKRIISYKEALELAEKEKTKLTEEINNQKNQFLLLKGDNESIEIKLKKLKKTLDDFSIKYNKCITAYALYKGEIKNNDFSNTIENKIMKLMDKFSDLGVNLKKPDWCDKNYTKRYDTASSILKQISALIGTNNDLRKFNTFIQDNQSFIIYGDRGCKQHMIKNINTN